MEPYEKRDRLRRVIPNIAAALELLGGDLEALLRLVVDEAAHARGLDARRAGLRLFDREPATPSLFDARVRGLVAMPWADLPPEAIGDVYEAAVALEASGRKRRGVFFTPPEVTREVVSRALAVCGEAPRACDPALGGGAFLLEVCRRLARGSSLREVAETKLFGIDLSPLAVATAEAAIWLLVGDADYRVDALRAHLVAADALDAAPGSFDLVIGNPPWVAYAGRAAQPLAPELRRELGRRFAAFRGYPTLHGLFVECAARLAPRGVVALLLPSPVADLAGYAPVRAALARTHSVREPLEEFGQDAFEGVTQPCFALIAAPGPEPGGERAWRLSERQRRASAAAEVAPPRVLSALDARPAFPRELFGEMGFQSSGDVSKTLLRRASEPDERHTYPLLEGKDVAAFRQGPPRLFLAPDADALRRARCRLRPQGDYAKVAFVVRQTALMPIAALHSGLPFRNTLLAGFGHAELPPALVVALLNSTLYRALHVARQRDARQAAFPQVKVAHLRALPRPPEDERRFARLCELTRALSASGPAPELGAELDRLVFELFDVAPDDRAEVTAFLGARTARASRA